jgi:DNA-binding NtrC family response regulator
MPETILPNRAPALLVDDNTDILAAIGRWLEAAGFDVVRARDGEEALVCLASGQRFALLVTDYAMSGLNGIDLANKALEQLPDLKVLIITGFLSANLVGNRPSTIAILAKPFRRAAMIEQLRLLFNIEPSEVRTPPDSRSLQKAK